MMNNPLLINAANISLAWAEAFLRLRSAASHRLSPLTLTFCGFDDRGVMEVPEIRSALDATLSASTMQRVQTVANTIFPLSLWQYAKGNRAALYEEYRANLPEYVAMEPKKNRRGLYFGRLIAYDLDARTGDRLAHIPEGSIPENGNQLEFIILHCKPGVRHSMFQASVFDPARDLTTSAQLGFPCLQHVTFIPHFKEGTMSLTAFYATQQLFEKGYGNFLGLARLGQFVASQVGLKLDRVTCFVGIEKMESKPVEGEALEALIEVCNAWVDRAAPVAGIS